VPPKAPKTESYFHLHLVSDSTGETLLAVGRAAAAQFATVSPIEHVFPLLRNQKQLDSALTEIESYPGIVLYTLVDHALGEQLETRCRALSVPCLSVLGPVLSLFHGYLGTETTPRVGGQHMLNAEYFRRIDALNFTMMHDDGQHTEDLEEADVVLVGISRTSKTPTSIYLANRGIKTLNIPLVPEIDPPSELEKAKKPLVVGLYASPERIVQIRQNRLLSLNAAQSDSAYIDRERVSQEIAAAKKLCARHGWPSIDVSRRSIEETAAAVIALLQERRRSAEPS
jgi:regulator of PEP synthase PpsR (kinase-PPPase family)